MGLDPIHLTLPPHLVAYAKKVAIVRHKPQYESHADDMQGEDWNYEFIGALTEVAFAWWAGMRLPDMNQTDGDGGVDFIMPDRRKIQVKGTARPDLNLLVPIRQYDEVKLSDVIVMGGVPKGMKPEEGAVDLVGWIPSTEFYEHAAKTTDRYSRKMYRLARQYLKPMRELM